MKNLTFTFFVLFAAVISPMAFAQSVPSTAEINSKIKVAVKGYANSISCGHTKIDSKKIAPLIPWTSEPDKLKAKYAVIWDGDVGCLGGSGTSGAQLAIVTVGTGSHFMVDPTRSTPNIHFNTDTRFIEKLVRNTKNTLVLEGLFLKNEDLNNFPSLKKRLTLKLDQKGNWNR